MGPQPLQRELMPRTHDASIAPVFRAVRTKNPDGTPHPPVKISISYCAVKDLDPNGAAEPIVSPTLTINSDRRHQPLPCSGVRTSQDCSSTIERPREWSRIIRTLRERHDSSASQSNSMIRSFLIRSSRN